MTGRERWMQVVGRKALQAKDLPNPFKGLGSPEGVLRDWLVTSG